MKQGLVSPVGGELVSTSLVQHHDIALSESATIREPHQIALYIDALVDSQLTTEDILVGYRRFTKDGGGCRVQKPPAPPVVMAVVLEATAVLDEAVGARLVPLHPGAEGAHK